jgi:hypothetical protein
MTVSQRLKKRSFSGRARRKAEHLKLLIYLSNEAGGQIFLCKKHYYIYY